MSVCRVVSLVARLKQVCVYVCIDVYDVTFWIGKMIEFSISDWE